jgi:hypothetical protein
LLNTHGVAILAIEVLLLGFASVTAIVLDHYRSRRSMRKQNPPSPLGRGPG